jgi:hypothetical protein
MSNNERGMSIVSRFTISYHFFPERRKPWSMMQSSDEKEMSKKPKEGRITRRGRERRNGISSNSYFHIISWENEWIVWSEACSTWNSEKQVH